MLRIETEHELLLDTLRYEPDTGDWFWLKRTSSRSKPGDRTGNISTNWKNGISRRYVRFNGKLHLSSRLAWFYMTGEWPKQTIDHLNRDALDDRWSNLRDVSYSTQNFNRARWRRSC